ncbi:MAG: hypothetical protein LQ350_001526 [Teloschistes chrysophthalmus]|nr:MAG: hypothetical protein LQ350_001526 [Niorma chrysophthalma]
MGSLPEPPPLGHINTSLVADIRSSLKGSEVLTPGSDQYESQLRRWSDMSIKRAGAILLQTSNADISTTLIFAQSHNLDFAVCGGGDATSGASSSHGGIVIDLSSMRSVTVDIASKTLTAQGGCLTIKALAGLLLGADTDGSRENIIDNLLSVEIVLANGRVVTSSPTENEDLFWAVRGAGQSFGVVTSFTYRCYEQKNPFFAGSLGFPPHAIPAVLDFANKSLELGKAQAGCILVFAVTPSPISQPMMLAVVCYNGPEDEARAFYKPLFDLEPLMDTTAMIPYSSLNSILNAASGYGGRKSTKGSTFDLPMRTEFALSIFDRWSDFVTEVPDASGSILLFEFFHMEKMCETSNRAMAFANRDFYENVMAAPKWCDEGNGQRCRPWARDMVARFEEEMAKAKTKGRTAKEMEGVGAYVNYDGEAPSVDVDTKF